MKCRKTPSKKNPGLYYLNLPLHGLCQEPVESPWKVERLNVGDIAEIVVYVVIGAHGNVEYRF